MKKKRKPKAQAPFVKGELIKLKSGEMARVFAPLNQLPDMGIIFGDRTDGEVWVCLKSEVVWREK